MLTFDPTYFEDKSGLVSSILSLAGRGVSYWEPLPGIKAKYGNNDIIGLYVFNGKIKHIDIVAPDNKKYCKDIVIGANNRESLTIYRIAYEHIAEYFPD